MKKTYESPELDITLFDYDILTDIGTGSRPGDQGHDDLDDTNDMIIGG